MLEPCCLGDARYTVGGVNATELRAAALVRQMVRAGALPGLRHGAGISQRQLAGLVGVTPGTCSRWEAGLRQPRAAQALALHRALVDLGVLDD
jgi:DNA-binding transcriptional regulator YiaG